MQAVASGANLLTSSWVHEHDGRLDPSSCQLGSFWENPAVSVFVGNETVNGVEGQVARSAARAPVRFLGYGRGALRDGRAERAANSSSYVWMLKFSDFVAGAPAFPDAFEVTDGVEYPSRYSSSSSTR